MPEIYGVMDTETTGLKPDMGHRPFMGGVHLFKIVDKGKQEDEMGATGGLQPETIKKEVWRPFDSVAAGKILSDKTITKVFQNAKFDMRMMHAAGSPWPAGIVDDTILMAKLGPRYFRSFELESMAKDLFGTADEEKLALKRWLAAEKDRRGRRWRDAGNKGPLPADQFPGYQDVPADIMDPYFAKDLNNPAQVYVELRPYFYLTSGHEEKYTEARAKAYRLELKQLWQTVSIEERGVLADAKYIDATLKKLQHSLSLLAVKFERQYGAEMHAALGNDDPFSPAKEDHIEWLVIKKLGLKPLRYTTTHAPSWDGNVLSAYSRPELAEIIEYRKTKKAYDYIASIRSHVSPQGTIHASLWQHGARTGRDSMTDPAIQTLPDDEKSLMPESIRKCFISRPGYRTFELDYKQMEVMFMAYYSEDPELLRIVNTGEDCHQMVADICGISRKFAKNIFFGISFCMGRVKLLQMFIKLGVEDSDFAAEFAPIAIQYDTLMEKVKKGNNRDAWRQAMDIVTPFWERSGTAKLLAGFFDRFPEVKSFKRDVQTAVKERSRDRGDGIGFITTYGGREVLVPENEAYKAINYVIQASATDVMKVASDRVYNIISTHDANILIKIHDAIRVEIGPGEDVDSLLAVIKSAMEDFPELAAGHAGIKLRVDIKEDKPSWAEQIKYGEVKDDKKGKGLSVPSAAAPGGNAGIQPAGHGIATLPAVQEHGTPVSGSHKRAGHRAPAGTARQKRGRVEVLPEAPAGRVASEKRVKSALQKVQPCPGPGKVRGKKAADGVRAARGTRNIKKEAV